MRTQSGSITAGVGGSPQAIPPLFLAIVAGLTVVVLIYRLGGINPDSLRLDDQWLAIVATRMSSAEFLEVRPPVPIGFVAAQACLARLWSDPEWPLQIAPVAASIAQVPLFALLLWRITSCPFVSLLGATLLAVNPQLAHYAVTPKQYASDSLLTVGLLWIGYPLLVRWSTRTAIVFVFAAAAALLFAFPSVFASVSLLSTAVVFCCVRDVRKRSIAAALGCWVALQSLLGVIYLTLLQGQSNLGMRLYWADHFVTLRTAGEAIRSTLTLGWSALAESLPGLIAPVAGLAVVGLAACVLSRPRRPLGVCLGLFLFGTWLASALQIYPLGTGRTDVYLYPVVILLIVLGLESSLLLFRINARARVVLVSSLCFTVLLLGRKSVYENVADAEVIRQLETAAADEDLVLIYPHAEFAVAYYSSWPARIQPSDVYAHGFAMEFSRPGTLKLPPPDATDVYPERLARLVHDFLQQDGLRLWYVATHIFPPGHEFVRQAIRGNGFELETAFDRPDAQLLTYRRRIVE